MVPQTRFHQGKKVYSLMVSQIQFDNFASSLHPYGASDSIYYRVLISPQPDQEGNKLQRPNSNFFKPLKKKNQKVCPSNQVSTAVMTSASDEKWRSFNWFFSRIGLRPYQHPCRVPAVYSLMVSQNRFGCCASNLQPCASYTRFDWVRLDPVSVPDC